MLSLKDFIFNTLKDVSTNWQNVDEKIKMKYRLGKINKDFCTYVLCMCIYIIYTFIKYNLEKTQVTVYNTYI